MATGEVYRLSVEFAAFGSNMANVFHFRQESEGLLDVPPFSQVLAERFNDVVVPAYVPILSTQTTINRIVVKGVTDPTDASELVISTAGNGPADPMPLGVAAVIAWRTARGDRSGRGRTYLGGFDENFANNAGAITATGISQLNDLADAIEPGMLSGDPDVSSWQAGIYSYTLAEFNSIISHLVRGFTKSQRDRNRK